MRTSTTAVTVTDAAKHLPTVLERAYSWASVHGPIAALVLIVAIISYKLLSMGINHAVSLISRDTFLSAEQAKQRAQTLGSVLIALARFAIFFVAGITILNSTGIFDVTALIASAGIFGVAIGFGAQSLVRDFISGFFILFENQYSVGEVVQIGSSKGVVESLGLRTTQLSDFDGKIHTIPNSEIKFVINESRGWSRAIVDIGVHNGLDTTKVIEAIERGLSTLADSYELKQIIQEPPQIFAIEAFREETMVFRITAVVQSGCQDKLARAIRLAVQSEFNKNGIEILTK